MIKFNFLCEKKNSHIRFDHILTPDSLKQNQNKCYKYYECKFFILLFVLCLYSTNYNLSYI